jgi:hypothetical protein
MTKRTAAALLTAPLLTTALTLGGTAAHADPRPVKSVSGETIARVWHCGAHFHGHKVRGYEVRTVFTRPVVYAHVASLPSFSTGLNRVVLVAACQL